MVVLVCTTGNGNLYSYAPKVNVELQGEVRKTYDGDATASVTDANFAMSGAIDGDTIDVLSFGDAYYADKNASAGKLVTVDDVDVSEATNGDVKVYGYQVDASSVSGNVGQIDRKVLTATADAANKTYDGTTSASLSNLALIGIVGGDEAWAKVIFVDRLMFSYRHNHSLNGRYQLKGTRYRYPSRQLVDMHVFHADGRTSDSAG